MGNGSKSSKRNCWRGRKVEREFGPAQRKQRNIRQASHTQVLCMGGQGILRVTRSVLRGVRRVQSVVRRGTEQYVVGMRRMESKATVVGELVGVIVIKKAVLDANHR